MYLLLLLAGIAAINCAAFWLFHARSRRIIEKIVLRHHEHNNRWLGRIEQRMARQLPPLPRPDQGVIVWAIVATYNRRDLLEQMITSLRRHEPNLHILVVDNGSNDGTIEFLATAHSKELVDKLVFNQHEQVPQWQKAFSIHQATALLALEPITHIVFIDDDVEITAPFVDRSIALLETLADRYVSVISLLTDAEQNEHHATIEELHLQGMLIRIKATFNGAFVFMPIETFQQFGLPPIREGSDDLAAEDWYYSRRLQTLGHRAACIENGVHLGADVSNRRKL